MRALVPFEVAAVLLAAVVSLPVPVVVPLLAIASLSMWARGRSFASVVTGPPVHAAVGAAAGASALVIAIVIGTPLVERVTDGAVQWSMYPVVRGSLGTFATLAVIVGVSALAAELVLRGWIVERVLELSRGRHAVLAVLVGAFAEALVVPGDATARIGAGLFGIALGWMFVAGGRSVVAPLLARLVFSLGALGLEALRVIG